MIQSSCLEALNHHPADSPQHRRHSRGEHGRETILVIS
jgi:hypothetical protein